MFLKYFAIIVGSIFEFYCIHLFMECFSVVRNKKKNVLLLLNSAILIYHIVISCVVEGIWLSLLAFVTTFLISQIYKTKQYIKLILSIAITVINISCEIVFGGIFLLIGQGTHIDINTTPEAYFLGILLSKFLVFIIVILIRMTKQSFSISHLGVKYLILLGVLPMTTLVLGLFMNQIILEINNNTQKLFYVILNLFLIFSNILTFNIIRHQNKLAETEYEFKLLKNSIDEQIKHYSDLRDSQEEIRRIKHDMKNTYIGLIAACEAGNIVDVLEKLKSNLEIINDANRIIDTEHPAIDTILENKLRQCEDYGIITNISLSYKNKININEIELSIIIGNILDNAIEACQKLTDSKEIWGMISSDKYHVIIDIKNSVAENNNLTTTKEDKKRHGFGIKSINHIAKKYNGKTKFVFSDGVFSTFVILEN